METLSYMREYAAGFRMPNLSKLWYGQGEDDEVDSGNDGSILIQVEWANDIFNRLFQLHTTEEQWPQNRTCPHSNWF